MQIDENIVTASSLGNKRKELKNINICLGLLSTSLEIWTKTKHFYCVLILDIVVRMGLKKIESKQCKVRQKEQNLVL